jgi:hypothetical protein
MLIFGGFLAESCVSEVVELGLVFSPATPAHIAVARLLRTLK